MKNKNNANARLQNLRQKISSPEQGNSQGNSKQWPRTILSTDKFSSNLFTKDSNRDVDLRTIRKSSHLDIKITRNMVNNALTFENFTDSTNDKLNIGRNLTSGREIETQSSNSKETQNRRVSDTLRNIKSLSDSGAANKRLESLRRSITTSESPFGESSKSKNVNCQNVSNNTQTPKLSSKLPDKTSTNKAASLAGKVPVALKMQERPIVKDNDQLISLATKVMMKQNRKTNKRLCESLNVPNSSNAKKPEKTIDKPRFRKLQTSSFNDSSKFNSEKLVTSTPETKLSRLPQYEQQKLNETWPKAATNSSIFGGTNTVFPSNSSLRESAFTPSVSQALLTKDNSSASLWNLTSPEASTSRSRWSTSTMQSPIVAQDIGESMLMDWSDEELEDINAPLQQTSPPMPSNQRNLTDLCIVVDTNVFLSNLAILNNLVSNEKRCGKLRPFLYVPWMVFTELDFIKDDSNASQKRNAQNAIKFIDMLLAENSGKLTGQNVYDVDRQKAIGKGPDDKILSCCLQAVEKYENVLFLTNDINLKNKALIHDIEVCSPSEVLKQIREDTKSNFKVKQISNELARCCSTIIIDCAIETYGNVWQKMDLFQEPPPWDLRHCLKIFKKYWIAMFQEKLLKQFQKNVDNLNILLSKDLRDTSKDFGSFLEQCLAMCVLLKDIEHLDSMITNTMRQMLIIHSSND